MTLTRDEFLALPILEESDCVEGAVYAWASTDGTPTPSAPLDTRGAAFVASALRNYPDDTSRRLVSRPARVGDVLTPATAREGLVVRYTGADDRLRELGLLTLVRRAPAAKDVWDCRREDGMETAWATYLDDSVVVSLPESAQEKAALLTLENARAGLVVEMAAHGASRTQYTLRREAEERGTWRVDYPMSGGRSPSWIAVGEGGWRIVGEEPARAVLKASDEGAWWVGVTVDLTCGHRVKAGHLHYDRALHAAGERGLHELNGMTAHHWHDDTSAGVCVGMIRGVTWEAPQSSWVPTQAAPCPDCGPGILLCAKHGGVPEAPPPVAWDGVPSREERRLRGACPCHGYPPGRCTTWEYEQRYQATRVNAESRTESDSKPHYMTRMTGALWGEDGVIEESVSYLRRGAWVTVTTKPPAPQTREDRLRAAGFRVEET